MIDNPEQGDRKSRKMAVRSSAVGCVPTIEAPSNRDELLRLAVQVGSIGIYETDFEQNRTRFSPELCVILGLQIGTELDYADASRLVDERDRAAVNALMEQARNASDEGTWNCIHRIMRPDGNVRWISVNGRRYYRDTPTGRQPVRAIGTVVDVTHLKEAEDALRQSELRLRLALDAAQMGTFEGDIAGTEATIDAQEARLLGLPEETRIVSTDELRARIPLGDLRVSDAKRERLERHAEAYHHEFRFRMPDGSERWLSAYAAIRAGRIFGVNFDVTPRKLAEIALRESETRLQIATSGAALGVFERDLKTDRTVWVNDRMYEIFGRTRADGSLTRQQFVEDYLHPDDVSAFEAALKDAIHTGGQLRAICRIYQKSGVQRWLQIDGKYEYWDTGEPSRLVGVVADITERKALEQEARELSERLIVLQEEERQRITQELHDSTAQQLVAASLNLMTLRTKVDPGSAAAVLCDEVEASMQTALKELRTFSYLMHPLALQADGLRLTIRQYLDGYVEHAGLTVRFRSNPKFDELPLEMQRTLFRIVQEALANVHRHASASHVSVELRCIAGQLHLMVSDNGHGIRSEVQERSQLHPGIGLLGIRTRARRFGGDLRVRTGTRGTSLHVAMPSQQARHRDFKWSALPVLKSFDAPLSQR